MTIQRKCVTTSLLLVACFFHVGCASLMTTDSKKKKKDKDSSWTLFKKKEYQIPQTMNVTWAHDILTMPGKPATRGFGGRFYFYNEKTQAIPVEGDLVVYGFDDTNKQQNKSEDLNLADKRFRFTAEQFTTHFSEGELGASYSIWIPWDEAFGAPKKIMLIPTFVSKDGKIIRGAAANLNLPGKAEDENTPGMIRQASATIPTAVPGQFANSRSQPVVTPSSSTQDTNSSMWTTTIQVPARTLMHGGPITPTNAAESLQNNPAFQDQFELQNRLLNQPSRHLNSVMSTTNNTVQDYGQMNGAVQPVSGSNALTSPNPVGNVSNQPNMVVQPMLNPPVSMPPLRASTNTNNPNGWALPEFSQAPYSELSARSSPNSRPVPASPNVQQTTYLTR